MEKCVVCLHFTCFFPYIQLNWVKQQMHCCWTLRHKFRTCEREKEKKPYNWCSLLSSLNRYLNLIKIFHTHLYLHVSVSILIQSKNFSTSPILVRDMTLFILSIKLMHFQVGCFFANSSYIYISARKENYKISKRILESIIFLKKNKCSLDDIFLVKKMCDFLVIIHWFDVCIIVLMKKTLFTKNIFSFGKYLFLQNFFSRDILFMNIFCNFFFLTILFI